MKQSYQQTDSGGREVTPSRITGEQNIEAPQSPLVLNKTFVRNLKRGETTPTVENTEVCRANNVKAVTVTDFLDGAEGQKLWILGDGFTTIFHGVNFFNNSGADLLLVADKMYHYVAIMLEPTESKNLTWFQVGVA